MESTPPLIWLTPYIGSTPPYIGRGGIAQKLFSVKFFFVRQFSQGGSENKTFFLDTWHRKCLEQISCQ
jgi:hypothetical protein